MAQRVILHVGAPKSGTTFVQSVLWHNRERLAAHGVLVPGRSLFDFDRAASAIRSTTPLAPRHRTHAAVWRRLVEETRRWPGTAMISNEWLSLASTEQAQRAIADLAPGQVHVVFTARDFVTQVPAAWQETLKLGRGQSLSEFIEGLDADGQRWSWWTLDPAMVLTRWGAPLPHARVHVVTVPPPGTDPGVLWSRFAQACGLDGGSYDLAAAQVNESLGAESARLLQRLGPLLREAIDADSAHWTEQYRWIRRYVGHELLVPRGGTRIGLDSQDVSVLRRRTDRTVAALAAAGYPVIGQLADLQAARSDHDTRHPDDVTDAELLDIALPVVADLLGRVRRETLRADAAEERPEAIGQRLAAQSRRRGSADRWLVRRWRRRVG